MNTNTKLVPTARVAFGLLTAICLGSAHSASIALFNTGVDGGGTTLADAADDLHYSVNQNGAAAAKVISNGLIPGTWLANDSNSRWIWQQADGQPTGIFPEGGGDDLTRTFKTTFDLTGLDPSTAVIAGRWSTDNEGDDILVNGISTGQTSADFLTWSSFSIDNSLLNSGINTIEFVVRDYGGIAGFRAEFNQATADAVPDSGSTLVLLGTGLLAGVFAVRRQTHSAKA